MLFFEYENKKFYKIFNLSLIKLLLQLGTQLDDREVFFFAYLEKNRSLNQKISYLFTKPYFG